MSQLNFFNTTALEGHQLAIAQSKAHDQNSLILEFFKNNPHRDYTPFEVQKYAGMHNIPITSVRRAISVLTLNGKLVKTGAKRKGLYGAPNFTWRLKNI